MKERKSNFELLRIVAMMLIISFHIVFHSEYEITTLNFNNYIIKVFWLFGEIGVNLFILISGYFMIKSKISIKKILNLIFELIFYNSISAIIAEILGGEGSILKIFYPPYWFVRMYIMLCFLSPFINRLIENISKKEYQKLLLICIIIWSIIPTIFGIAKNSSESLDFYCRMIWLIVMYLIGGYIRIYGIKFLATKKSSIIVSIISFCLLCLSIIVIYYSKMLIPPLKNLEIAYLWRPNNIIILIFSISLFKIFEKIDIGSKKIINTIASTTLGIYLIHDGLLRKFIWQDIFHTKEMLETRYVLLYIFGVTILIFVCGMIVDLIRQYISKKTVDKMLNSNYLDKCIKKINTKLGKFLEKYI